MGRKRRAMDPENSFATGNYTLNGHNCEIYGEQRTKAIVARFYCRRSHVAIDVQGQRKIEIYDRSEYIIDKNWVSRNCL